MNYRVSATHDLLHILNGFGELGVISLSVAQYSTFLNLMVLLLGWFWGYPPSTNWKPVFSVIWEERMEQNLQ